MAMMVLRLAEPAMAENAAAPAAALEEIIVTAQKRETNLQQTPISITAVTGQDLAAAGISDVAAIAQRTPGVALSSAGAGRTVYNINGISSAAGASSTVGFYLDDVPLTPRFESLPMPRRCRSSSPPFAAMVRTQLTAA
jgi:outer membrane receptor protein involved in Fe transport